MGNVCYYMADKLLTKSVTTLYNRTDVIVNCPDYSLSVLNRTQLRAVYERTRGYMLTLKSRM